MENCFLEQKARLERDPAFASKAAIRAHEASQSKMMEVITK
jgi:hypothetical protein